MSCFFKCVWLTLVAFVTPSPQYADETGYRLISVTRFPWEYEYRHERPADGTRSQNCGGLRARCVHLLRVLSRRQLPRYWPATTPIRHPVIPTRCAVWPTLERSCPTAGEGIVFRAHWYVRVFDRRSRRSSLQCRTGGVHRKMPIICFSYRRSYLFTVFYLRKGP